MSTFKLEGLNSIELEVCDIKHAVYSEKEVQIKYFQRSFEGKLSSKDSRSS